MPKKSAVRPGRGRVAPTQDARPRRPGRPAPRPAAVLPVGSASDYVPQPAATASATSGTPTSSRPASPAARVSRPARSSSLAAITDYSYVTSDLRRIGLLAGVAFAVLIGLTFVVH